MRAIVKLFLLTVMVLTLCSGALFAEREQHDFTLYEANHMDPFTLSFPITVKGPCEIRITLFAESFDTSMQVPLILSLYKTGRTKPVKRLDFKAAMETVTITYPVDSDELALGGEYSVRVGNRSTKKNATGELAIGYTGKEGPEPPREALLPDLTVTSVRLNKEGTVTVVIENAGRGRLGGAYWKSNVPELFVRRNGKNWGGASLKNIDPEKKLRRSGGRVGYTLATLKVRGTETITVTIDSKNTLREENEKNNSIEESLTAAQ